MTVTHTNTPSEPCNADAASSLMVGVDLGGGIFIDRLIVRSPAVLAALAGEAEVWSQYPVRILDAPKGSGKTSALAALTARGRLVCVVDRSAAVAAMSSKFNATTHAPAASSRFKQTFADIDRIALTPYKMGVLSKRWAGGVLVIDEARRCIGTLARGIGLMGLLRGSVYGALLQALRDADEVWCAEADWADRDVRAMAELVRRARPSTRLLHIVVEMHQRRGTAIEQPNWAALRDVAIEAAATHPVFYASSSCMACEIVAAEMVHLGMDPLVVTARTTQKARVAEWLCDPSPDREPVVIVSPSLVSGVSVGKITASRTYSHVFLEFSTWPGGPVLEDALQFACRVRGTPDLEWWAAPGQPDAKETKEHYADEQAIAQASAALLGGRARAGTELDRLVAERAGAAAASLRPAPRVAVAAGLTRDGWLVKSGAPTKASAEATARWSTARARAVEAYLQDLQDRECGVVDSRTIARRKVELADYTQALDGVLYLEREHRHERPVDLLVATTDPGLLRRADEEEQGFPSWTDMRHLLLGGKLAADLLNAAGVSAAELVAGESVTVSHGDLGAFIALAQNRRVELFRLLNIQAPKGGPGSSRSLLTLLSRLGCERGPVSRAGADRARSYRVRLHPVVLAAHRRRTRPAGQRTATLPPDQALLSAVDAALAARSPLRVLAASRGRNGCVLHSLAEEMVALQERATTSSEDIRRHLEGAMHTLGQAVSSDGRLWASQITREDSGRIHLSRAAIQNIPNSVRHLIVPWLADYVIVSVDFCCAHWMIAAAVTKDVELLALQGFEGQRPGDIYEALAKRFVPGDPDGRAKMKRAAVPALNGAGVGTLADALGSQEAAVAFHRWLHALPGFANAVREARTDHAAPGSEAAVQTLTGGSVIVQKAEGTEGWRRLLNARWACVEAAALDYALAHLPHGCLLGSPMYDGLFVVCKGVHASRVATELHDAMVAGACAAGFDARVKVGIGESWGEAEKTSRVPFSAAEQAESKAKAAEVLTAYRTQVFLPADEIARLNALSIPKNTSGDKASTDDQAASESDGPGRVRS